MTSYYVNTKDLSEKSVTLNIKVTDNDGKEHTVNKPVSVNFASTSAPAGDAPAEGETAE